MIDAQLAKVKRAREIPSHKTPNASLAEVLDAALDEFLARKDPLQKIVKERRTKAMIAPGASEALRVESSLAA